MAAPAERDGVTDLMHAAWPGRAPLIKGLKLINLWFHMVGCFRFVSPLLFPSHMFSLSLSLSLISTDVPANEAAGFFFFGHLLWFHIPDSSTLTATSFHLLSLSPSESSHLLFSYFLLSSSFFIFLSLSSPHPTCQARLCPYRWVQSSKAVEKRGWVITLHRLSPPYQPHYSSSGP